MLAIGTDPSLIRHHRALRRAGAGLVCESGPSLCC